MSSASLNFALEFSSQGVPIGLLEELAGRVVRHVGCTAPPPGELTAALTRATAGSPYGGAARCDLQFRTHNQKLEILVSANGGRVWQCACPVNAASDL